MLLFWPGALGRRASEPPTYMVDGLRGQELPSGALRPPPARPACPRAQTASRWPPLGEGRTRTSGSYASHAAVGDTLSRVASASYLGAQATGGEGGGAALAWRQKGPQPQCEWEGGK